MNDLRSTEWSRMKCICITTNPIYLKTADSLKINLHIMVIIFFFLVNHIIITLQHQNLLNQFHNGYVCPLELIFHSISHSTSLYLRCIYAGWSNESSSRLKVSTLYSILPSAGAGTVYANSTSRQ